MAEMWREISEQFELVQDGNSTRGRRVFVRSDSNGSTLPANLPTVGTTLMVDEDDANVTGCLCRTVRTAFQSGDPYPWKIYEFSTEEHSLTGGAGGQASQPGKQVPERDDSLGIEPTRFDTGTDTVSFVPGPGSGKWTWAGTGDPVEQPVTRPVLVGNWMESSPNVPEASLATYKAKLHNVAFCINHAAFRDFAIGQVMFTGYSGGSYRDEAGALQHRFNLHFAFRIIKDPDTAITQDDWLYEVNQTAASGDERWDQPKSDTFFLYTKADLTALFTV